MNLTTFIHKVAAAFVSLFVCAAIHAQSNDDVARLLAGLPVTGPLTSFTQNSGWQGHAAAMDKAWKTKEYFQLGPIAAWMAAHAGEYYHSTDTMYYMFSGPDFLYANAFFPDASTYILAGLEPVGQVPDLSRMSPEVLNANLGALRSSMSTLLITHYFVTEEMKGELGRSNLSGTIPILYVLLARMGCTVLDTTYVHSPAEGVRITFSRNDRSQTLFYFKTDLSGGNSGFLLFPTSARPSGQHTQMAWFVRDIVASVAELRRRGVRFEDYDVPGLKTIDGIADLGYEKSAWFRDSEGNLLALGQLA